MFCGKHKRVFLEGLSKDKRLINLNKIGPVFLVSQKASVTIFFFYSNRMGTASGEKEAHHRIIPGRGARSCTKKKKQKNPADSDNSAG